MNKNKTCLDAVPIFSELTDEEKMEIALISKHKVYEKGRFIYQAGEMNNNLYIIHQGKVKIVRYNPQGKEQIISILSAGAFMGELALFSKQPVTGFSEALEKSEICMIEGDGLRELMRKYPSISLKIMQELATRLDTLEQRLELTQSSVEQRLAQYLLEQADEQGRVNLTITKTNLASLLSTSLETLSRKLGVFQDLGYISHPNPKEIIIRNRTALSALLE